MNQNDTDRMMQMITGDWVTQVVHAAAKFSIADHLATVPATAEDIVEERLCVVCAIMRP